MRPAPAGTWAPDSFCFKREMMGGRTESCSGAREYLSFLLSVCIGRQRYRVFLPSHALGSESHAPPCSDSAGNSLSRQNKNEEERKANAQMTKKWSPGRCESMELTVSSGTAKRTVGSQRSSGLSYSSSLLRPRERKRSSAGLLKRAPNTLCTPKGGELPCFGRSKHGEGEDAGASTYSTAGLGSVGRGREGRRRRWRAPRHRMPSRPALPPCCRRTCRARPSGSGCRRCRRASGRGL